jgi:hypothetical protein
MMATNPTDPNADDREKPGDTQTNPAGVSTEEPAEGADDAPAENSGSPQG